MSLHMSTNETKRITGKKVVLAFLSLIGITVIVALLAFFRAKDPRGTILAMAAIDEDSAALFRDISRKRGYVHLTKILADDSQPVKITLFGIPKGSQPRVIDGLIVADVFEARGYPTVQAFSADDLSFRYWSPEPARTLADEQPATSTDLVVDGTPWIATAYAGTPGELLVIDARTGEGLLRKELAGLEPPLALSPLNHPEPGVLIRHKGGELRLRLSDGGSYEGELFDERDCRHEDGALIFGDTRFEMGDVSAEFAPFKEGCVSHHDGELRVFTRAGERRYRITSRGPLLDFHPSHLSGNALFLAMGSDVAIVELPEGTMKKAIDGLDIAPF